MKTRSDFVSNSSSSSFVVLHKDNKYGLLLDGDEVEHLSLHEYIEMFGKNEFLGWNLPVDKKMKYVSDSVFIKHFMTSDGNDKILPKCCKAEYDEMIGLEKQRQLLHEEDPDIKWNDPRIESFLDAEDKLEKAMLKKVEDILSSTYNEETFDYVVMSDHDSAEDDIDGCRSLEDKTLERIKFAKKLIPSFKFFRYNNMH